MGVHELTGVFMSFGPGEDDSQDHRVFGDSLYPELEGGMTVHDIYELCHFRSRENELDAINEMLFPLGACSSINDDGMLTLWASTEEGYYLARELLTTATSVNNDDLDLDENDPMIVALAKASCKNLPSQTHRQL